jgi:arylsulfatase A-like enzyme
MSFEERELLVIDRPRPLQLTIDAPLSFRSTPRLHLGAVVRGEGFQLSVRLEREGVVVASTMAPLVRSRGLQEFVIDLPLPEGSTGLEADRVVLGLPPGPLPIGIASLRIEDLPVDGRLPAEAFGGIALLEIGGDGRHGTVLSSGAEARAQVRVSGPGRELRFADAVPAEIAARLGAPELELVLRAADGAEERRRFTPGPAWTDRVVPLDTLAGQELTVEFLVHAAGGDGGLALLSRPWIATPLEAPPTVLLVTSDTHRADHLGLVSGEDGPHTELLDQLAARGVTFLDAISSINNTTPSHVALLTGTPPRDTGILSNARRLSQEAPTLADRFAERGFVTLAAVSAAPVCSEFSALDQGFDRYSNPDFRSARDGAETLAQLLDWLPALEDQPLFVWLHLYDAHSPYDPPEELLRLYYPEDRGPLDPASPIAQPELAPDWAPEIMDPVYTESLYKGEVSYVDRRLAELFGHERFWDGVVAFTADHGETLRRGGIHRFGHHTLSHANLAVPLVLAAPGLEAGARVETPVQHLDVGRTLLDLAGYPEAEFPGTNLLLAAESTPPDTLRFAMEANGYSAAVLQGRWMLKLGLREDRSVLEKTGDWYHRAELHDVTVDEACEHDLSAEHPELTRELRTRLVEWLRGRRTRDWSREARGDAETVARQLAELGYTGTDPAAAERDWVPVDCPCPNCRAAR